MKNLYPAKGLLRSLLLLSFLSLQFSSKAYQLVSTNFYIVGTNGVATLKDGNLSIYDNQYSNGVDWEDGTKMNNTGENFGIIRNGASLVVERRKTITGKDTCYFNMWGMQLRNYRFEITVENFNSLTQAGYVWDNYLHSMKPLDLNGITTVDFSVTSNAASKAAGRFSIIYTSPAEYAQLYAQLNSALSVKITGIKAVRKADLNNVSWTVESEASIDNYEVQYSKDGAQFKTIYSMPALNTATAHEYIYKDPAAGNTVSYYRIIGNSKDGRKNVSPVAKISAENKDISLNVYPNPVTNKMVQLQWNLATATTFKVSLVYPSGTIQPLKAVKAAAGQSSSTLELPSSTMPGIYQLRFTDGENKTQVKTIIVL